MFQIGLRFKSATVWHDHLHTYHFDKLMADYQQDELVPCRWSARQASRPVGVYTLAPLVALHRSCAVGACALAPLAVRNRSCAVGVYALAPLAALHRSLAVAGPAATRESAHSRRPSLAFEVLSAVRNGARADIERQPLAAVRQPRARLPPASARCAPCT